MKLSSILDSELVIFDVPGSTRDELYSYMLQKVAQKVSFSVPEILRGIISREDAIGMSYDDGVALPHVRSEIFNDLHVIIGLPLNPVFMTPGDKKPSQLIIMSLIGATTSDIYLKSLAAFGKYLRSSENFSKLVRASDGESFIQVLADAKIEIKKTITAEDIYSNDIPALSMGSPISEALDIFNRTGSTILPVVDKSGKLVGELLAEKLIRHFVPEYIFMMDQIKFLNSFEPFDRIFKEEDKSSIDLFVDKVTMIAGLETPLIQLTVSLVRYEARKIFVVDPDGRLLGDVSIKNIIHRVLRG